MNINEETAKIKANIEADLSQFLKRLEGLKASPYPDFVFSFNYIDYVSPPKPIMGGVILEYIKLINMTVDWINQVFDKSNDIHAIVNLFQSSPNSFPELMHRCETLWRVAYLYCPEETVLHQDSKAISRYLIPFFSALQTIKVFSEALKCPRSQAIMVEPVFLVEENLVCSEDSLSEEEKTKGYLKNALINHLIQYPFVFILPLLDPQKTNTLYDLEWAEDNEPYQDYSVPNAPFEYTHIYQYDETDSICSFKDNNAYLIPSGYRPIASESGVAHHTFNLPVPHPSQPIHTKTPELVKRLENYLASPMLVAQTIDSSIYSENEKPWLYLKNNLMQRFSDESLLESKKKDLQLLGRYESLTLTTSNEHGIDKEFQLFRVLVSDAESAQELGPYLFVCPDFPAISPEWRQQLLEKYYAFYSKHSGYLYQTIDTEYQNKKIPVYVEGGPEHLPLFSVKPNKDLAKLKQYILDQLSPEEKERTTLETLSSLKQEDEGESFSQSIAKLIHQPLCFFSSPQPISPKTIKEQVAQDETEFLVLQLRPK